jgi:aspartyl-tRNA(Asn)/glutamyl-tRNA(Gln) amidotransferase subunit A
MTIEEFGRLFRAGKTTSLEVTEECLNTIASDDDRLNAFILVMAGRARAEARQADGDLAAGIDRGPLHGVPISIKDMVDLRNTSTTAASRVREGHVAQHDASVVARLRHAGAVFVGKTNLHEFAYGTTSEDSAFGPVRNPHDPSRSPGGSSGGSAVSVASGMALATIGTDTGGSIRIPAAACGVVGLKPTYGEISTDGVVPLSRTLDHVGPIAGTVTDAWYVYRALTDGAPSDESGALGGRQPPKPANVDGLRLAIPRAYFCDLLDLEVRARFEAAIERLRKAGARIADVNIPHAPYSGPVYLAIQLTDAAAYHATTLETQPERYTTPVRLRLEMGRYVMGEDYSRALAGREVLRREVEEALAGHNALLLPTLPIPAPPLGAATVEVAGTEQPVRNLMLRLTQLFNLTGHPAISLPCGRTAGGLPCGLQLVGSRMQTEALLAVALACERELGREPT